MLVFGDARLWHGLVGIVDDRDGLELSDIVRLVAELEAAIGQLAEFPVEIFVDRPGVDDVRRVDVVADIAEVGAELLVDQRRVSKSVPSAPSSRVCLTSSCRAPRAA